MKDTKKKLKIIEELDDVILLKHSIQLNKLFLLHDTSDFKSLDSLYSKLSNY